MLQIFYKEFKRNASNDTIDFKRFVQENHASLYATTYLLRQFDEKNSYESFEVLKF